MKNKIAMITGVGGMDGSILAEKLLDKGYKVIGIDRWNPTASNPNLRYITKHSNFVHVTGDIREKYFMERMIKEYKPDYLYNLAAISLVPESFKIPQDMMEINTLAVINMLEILRTCSSKTRFYQASSSEQIGKNGKRKQNTDSKMIPNSPYAIAKLASFHFVRLYREAFGLFAVNGMLWNHEGPRRGPTFVTRKITLGVSKIAAGLQEKISLGNIDAARDWGLASDYCDAMITIMEANKPDDYAVATGETHSVREFVEEAFRYTNMEIAWKGKGVREKGYDQDGNVRVDINPKYYRPTEVEMLHGDPTKIRKTLGWKPKTKFKGLVALMMKNDLNTLSNSMINNIVQNWNDEND